MMKYILHPKDIHSYLSGMPSARLLENGKNVEGEILRDISVGYGYVQVLMGKPVDNPRGATSIIPRGKYLRLRLRPTIDIWPYFYQSFPKKFIVGSKTYSPLQIAGETFAYKHTRELSLIPESMAQSADFYTHGECVDSFLGSDPICDLVEEYETLTKRIRDLSDQNRAANDVKTKTNLIRLIKNRENLSKQISHAIPIFD